MVDTWRVTLEQVTFASGKSMAFVMNKHASNVVSVTRAFQFNNQIATAAGVIAACTMQVIRITALGTPGTAVTPIPHDPANTALTSITCGHAYTSQTQAAGVFRQYKWSNDESTLGGTWSAPVQAQWELLFPYCLIWDAGFVDAVVQPFVCNVDEGFQLYHSGSSAVGTADFCIEFTHTVV